MLYYIYTHSLHCLHCLGDPRDSRCGPVQSLSLSHKHMCRNHRSGDKSIPDSPCCMYNHCRCCPQHSMRNDCMAPTPQQESGHKWRNPLHCKSSAGVARHHLRIRSTPEPQLIRYCPLEPSCNQI